MWKRWQDKALYKTTLEKRFAEKFIRNRTSSEMASAEDAAKLLGHSNVTTTNKHYRVNPTKVKPFLKSKNEHSMGQLDIYGTDERKHKKSGTS